MTAAAQVYEASHIKRRRATAVEMQDRRDRLMEITRQGQPMSVRQVYYQGSVHSLVDKTESGYTKVQTSLVGMRRSGLLPYSWITDHTRYQRKPRSYDSIHQALEETARLYRKDLWSRADAYVEVWIEKDALSGVVYPVTAEYDVPLMSARGYASLSFLHSAAEYIGTLDVPVFIYHLGDYDPSGVNAGEKIEQTLRELAPKANITFQRLAVLPEQISAWNLPTRPTKTTDTRSKGFSDVSVELDAIEPNQLRSLVRRAIEQHLSEDQLNILKVAEESERQTLQWWARAISEQEGAA